MPSTSGRNVEHDGRAESRPSRRRLTRLDVLETALRLIDENGVEALSMRRLGRALDRDPMRLYRFAASKDELLDGVVELVLDELDVPSSASARAWPEVLRATAHLYRRIALRHPHIVPLLVTRPLATPLGLRPPGTLRPLEALLDLLITAGFEPRGALHAYRFYMGFLQGHVLTELQERVQNPDETDALLRLGLYRLPPREFPRLRSLAPALVAYDGAQELDEGLDIILGGLRRQLDRGIPLTSQRGPDGLATDRPRDTPARDRAHDRQAAPAEPAETGPPDRQGARGVGVVDLHADLEVPADVDPDGARPATVLDRVGDQLRADQLGVESEIPARRQVRPKPAPDRGEAGGVAEGETQGVPLP